MAEEVVVMDGATTSLITGGAFLLLGTGIAHSWTRTNRIEKKQNRDHDCIIGLKKDTEYIREKMDAVIKVLNSINGKKVI